MTSANSMICDQPSGISILVVGGGLGGLTMAIESYRKGHDVRLIERRPEFDTFGDLIGITRSAQRTMLKWPGFLNRLMANAMPAQITYFKFDGTEIATLGDRDRKHEGIISMGLWRSMLHGELYKYAAELGIPIIFNQNVIEYSETDDQGSVVTGDGTRYSADVVVAADGLASKSTNLIVSNPEIPTSSGYAIYRTSFPLDQAMKDPIVAEHWSEVEGVQIFFANKLHIVTAKSSKTNKIAWMMTHRDEGDTATEGWSAECPASEALRYVPVSEGWAPYIPALIKTTPGNRCVNWKLMWRSPQQPWTSPKGRIVQIGDSCHPFIPTSGSGAVMAIEDAYSLATCLQIVGKHDIALAVSVHTKLRFERTAFAQRLGFDNREFLHHPNWDTMMRSPETLSIVSGWITEHDAEKYAHDNFAECAKHLKTGSSFSNTNIPRGKAYVPWTIRELQETAKQNKDPDSKL